jgi:dTDP-4-dehydrorhamnose reductase
MVAPVKKMKWMILGGDSQLGRAMGAELAKVEADCVSLNHAQLDITNQRDINDWFTKESPNVVLNTAAWTNVDSAEAHEDEAFRINAFGPKLLAAASAEIEAAYIHISTDYVFSGNSGTPIREETELSPVSAYGRTKAQGERYALDIYPNGTYIVRTAWLYSPWGKNFVKTMLRIALEESRQVEVVNDQIGSPTSASDLAEQIHKMILHRIAPGIYHGTNKGQASWFEFAQEIFALAEQDSSRIIPVSSANFPRPAQRPAFSVLGFDHWLNEGMNPMQNWKEGLKSAFPAIVLALQQGELIDGN